MTFTVHAIDQRTPEWMALRAGRVTSSSAEEMLSEGRGGKESAGRRNLRVRLALERIAGKSLEREKFQTQAMRDGCDREADATAAYEAMTGELLTKSGFLAHNELMAGASLDGHRPDFSRIAEIKSPEYSAHLSYLRTGKIPSGYLTQVTHQLLISGAEACDWFSFNPDFPEKLRIKLVTVKRADVDLSAYELLLRQFLREVDTEQAEILRLAA